MIFFLYICILILYFLIMRNDKQICFECKHFAGNAKGILEGCRAYPDGIDWQKSITEHNKPFDDQEGDYVFEWVCEDCSHSARYHKELPLGACLAYPNGKDGLGEFIGKGHKKILPNQEGDYIYTPYKD
jgi:hypothetical protein